MSNHLAIHFNRPRALTLADFTSHDELLGVLWQPFLLGSRVARDYEDYLHGLDGPTPPELGPEHWLRLRDFFIELMRFRNLGPTLPSEYAEISELLAKTLAFAQKHLEVIRANDFRDEPWEHFPELNSIVFAARQAIRTIGRRLRVENHFACADIDLESASPPLVVQAPVPVQEVGDEEPPPAPPPSPGQELLTKRALRILEAMYALKLFDSDHWEPARKIALKAFGRRIAESSLKAAMKELRRSNLVASKGGREGGYYLTDLGRARAAKLVDH